MFPSPIGELHFSIIKKRIQETCKSVSVPYRGATFLNPPKHSERRVAACFRPLSGSYISQFLSNHLRSENFAVSVPYRGATFLNKNRQQKNKIRKGFRPLSGSYISQLFHIIPVESVLCFRPLSGSYISQSFYLILW